MVEDVVYEYLSISAFGADTGGIVDADAPRRVPTGAEGMNVISVVGTRHGASASAMPFLRDASSAITRQ